MNTIFVSSTFRDMNAERDAIMQKVVPLVDTVAEQYGENVWCKDLRWGINTTDLAEDEANTKVLSVCLDEIDRSRPPFVILLGERYGWIPDPSLISSQARRKNMHLGDLEISVTALEIEYGAFCRNYTPIVYFREAEGAVPRDFRAEDEEHRAKLDQLKARLRAICGDRIRFYRMRFDENGPDAGDLDAFARRLSQDICDILKPHWEEFSRLSPRQKELTLQQRYLDERTKQYIHASEDEQTIYDTLMKAATTRRTTISPYAGLYLYQNTEGSGKSMLFARTAQHLAEDPRNVVLAFTAGLTPRSTSAVEILKSTVYALETYTRSPHMEDESPEPPAERDYRDQLEELCDYLADNGRRLFFLVDGVDKLQPGNDLDKLVFLPGSGRDGIAMLLTARSDYATPLAETISPAAITFRERQFALDGLMAYYGRELAEPVKLAVLEKTRRYGLLHVSMLLKRLLRMSAADFAEINRRGGSIEAINAYQMELVEQSPESLEELSYQIMEIIGEGINPPLVRQICNLLCISPFGLRESDLATIIGSSFNSLDLAALLQAWSECFLVTEDGRIQFQIESVAVGRFDHLDDPTAMARMIFEHLRDLDERDEFRRKYLLFYAQLSSGMTDPAVLRYIDACTDEGQDELLGHAAYALWRGSRYDDGRQLMSMIISVGFAALRDAGNLSSFLSLWTILMMSGEYFRTDPVYGNIVETYYDIALKVRELFGGRFASSLDMRIEDCCRVLAGYYADRGDFEQAEKYRGLRRSMLGNPFGGGEPDEDDASEYLLALSEEVNTAQAQFGMTQRKDILAKAEGAKDELLGLCRRSWVKEHLPFEALLGLVAVEQFETTAARSSLSEFSVADDVDGILTAHPELMEDETALIAVAQFYSAEASRLSHALKDETIPADRREKAIRYGMAAQEAYGRIIQQNPTREMCLALAMQKLNTARLLEQRGTEDALVAALSNLLDASSALGRVSSLPGNATIDPLAGFGIYNRMGIIASKLDTAQLKNVIEEAFDKTLAYGQSIPDTEGNLLFMIAAFQNQAEILEKMGQGKQLEMAELRYAACEALMEPLTTRDVLRQLPFAEQLKLKKWKGDLAAAHKKIKRKLLFS